ncbi:hypothetical protein UFOVP181_130 [uncultured Caudovirales phage]|uniref:PA14 domain-containing protein n=1 Tax=uncultured Caudovirales phage TaxID=2100421 RepID=A0A6J7WGW2_9CAUD|nr:hypothetical protein UFOVP57_32 [uncultured Caudovirales phage]CAB5208721.1 hypothetical protein UFOVP181_130 [uncultured Caudovirales phage]
MKQILAGILMILAVASLEFACTRPAHAAASYETWACPTWPCPTSGQTILSTGTFTGLLNFDWGGGNVLNSGRADYVVVHTTGSFTMSGVVGQSYNVTFLNQDDDGSRLIIGGTTVIEDWSGLHGPANRTGNITLIGGQTYTYERFFSEWGGGAVMRQQWYRPGIDSGYVYMNADTDLFIQSQQPTYASAITAAQQNRINSAASRLAAITHNGIYIDQVGNNTTINVSQEGRYNQVSGVGATYAPVQGDLNNITIRQGDPGSPTGKNLIEMTVQGTGSNTLNLNQGRDSTGGSTGLDVGGHYQAVGVAGYGNTVTTQQQNAGGVKGNYLEANIVGNYNTVGLIQTDGTTQKQTFASVNGNNNTLSASQTGLGAHYLEVSLNGNGNTATVNQLGNTANAATISLTNAGGPASVNLTQTGGQTYNISTVCVTVGGCAPITVKQGN